MSTSAKIGRRVYAGKCVTVFPSVEIGDFTTINSSSWIESGTLGKFCSVAANVSIGMEEHPLHHVSTHVATYDSPLFGLISKPKERLHSKPAPQIGNDVWLARGAIVLRGVNIGDGATVGAGAVVTKDVEPYAIVAGAPARVVRYRFSNAEIASLRALEWWNDPEFYEREFERRPIGIQHFDLPHRDS